MSGRGDHAHLGDWERVPIHTIGVACTASLTEVSLHVCAIETILFFDFLKAIVLVLVKKSLKT